MFSTAALLLTLAAAGCEDKGIGGLCDLGANASGSASVNETIFNSSALECPSRICLRQAPFEGAEGQRYSGIQPLCSDTCSSDGDCDGQTATQDPADPKMNKALCHSGFVCAVSTTVGPFACKKLCICKDYFALDANKNPIITQFRECTGG